MNVAAGIAACALIGIVVATFRGFKRQHSNLPPGPSGRWITGNVNDFFTHYPWRRFSAWSKAYGDIIYLTVFGRPVIILNKFEDARELMDRRGSMYSDRTPMVYIVDVLRIRSATFMPYGDTWRAHRRLMQQYLNPRAVTAFRPIQAKCVRTLLEDLLTEPVGFWKHAKRFVASTVLSTTYGYTVMKEKDPLVELNARAEGAFVRFGPPGATMIDFFPLLRFVRSFVPGSFRRYTGEAQAALQEMSRRPYDIVKKQKAAGTAGPSLLSHMLDDCEQRGVEDELHYDDVKDVCGSTYRAGVGTTSSVLYLFILTMVLHPHVAKKAQDELDAVSKCERLPSFDDQEALPYIGCIFKECLRWAPPFPLGIAHRAMADGELNDKCIPMGSMIIPNIWHMMHDERNYVDAKSFNPDRFIRTDHDAKNTLDPRAAAFGFGRRICPGRHFAEASLWLAMANILAVFEILPEVDEKGENALPKVDFIPRLNSWSLKEFSCRFVPRNKKAAGLVQDMD